MTQLVSPGQDFKTRHVFIDTSIYERTNFSFSGQRFAALKVIVMEDKISLYTTTITRDEVFARIANAVSDAVNAQRSIRNKLKILRNLETFTLYFADLDESQIKSEIENLFLEFIREFQVETIHIADINPEEVFADYFNKRPPFGEGKKKYEFPDAFVIAGLHYWCKKHIDRKIYVVSADEGMRNACESYSSLHAIETIDELTDLVSSHFDKIHPIVHSLLSRYESEIKCHIRDEFARINFVLDEWDGEIKHVSVNSVKINNIFILGIGESGGLADVRSRVYFSVDLLLPPDLDGEIYDYSDWDEERIERHYDVSFAVDFDYDTRKLDKLQIKHVDILDELDTIYIHVEDYDF